MTREDFPNECFVCHQGHKCGGKGIEELSDEQISQLGLILNWIDVEHFLYPCKCNAASIFEDLKKYIPHLDFFEKYDDKIKALYKWQSRTFNVEEFITDIHGDTIELFWCWDDYNGLYTTSGAMKALYHNEGEDETWSKAETKALIEYFDLEYESINSFEDLLKVIDIEKIEVDEDN
jgi:hypothetical protein